MTFTANFARALTYTVIVTVALSSGNDSLWVPIVVGFIMLIGKENDD